MDESQTTSSDVVELEVNENDILYYITNQDDNEIGFAVLENGVEVEYFYETNEQFRVVETIEEVHEAKSCNVNCDATCDAVCGEAATAGENTPTNNEPIEMEVNEADIAYYIVDQDDNEIGFAVLENGAEVEYFYAEESDVSQTSQNSEQVAASATSHTAASATNDVSASTTANTKASITTNTTPVPQASSENNEGGEDEAEPLFTSEQLSEVKDDVIGILKDGASLASEFKDAYKEFNEVLDFLPKKRR